MKPWEHIKLKQPEIILNQLEEDYQGPWGLVDSISDILSDLPISKGSKKVTHVASGFDAVIYKVSATKVAKLTRNRADAKVLQYLLDNQVKSKHIVYVDRVMFLKSVNLWYVEEELLSDIPSRLRTKLYKYKNGDLIGPTFKDVDKEFKVLEKVLTEHKIIPGCDCLSPHNIMMDPVTKSLKVHDFGYTQFKYKEDYEVR
jgi:hypothetical protein